ncbi:hypothetical protein ACFRKE_07060 [Kitasatospora indigofera]|uniref:hypothetical protein n=1 Tax=Kitasatospora indigofera TaxID=67307 RepID=UPI00368D63E3
MSRTSDVPNAGTRRTGERFSRHNQPDLTRDGEGGRWLAVDEAAHHGDKLFGRRDRYLVLGSVLVDDTEAAGLVEQLRREGRVQKTAPELKFGNLSNTRHSRELLAQALSPGGLLAGRVTIFLTDRHYMIAAKLVDLLIEKYCHARGINIVDNGAAKTMALTIANRGPGALSSATYERLLADSALFFSKENRSGDRLTVDALYATFRTAALEAARGSDSDVTWILQQLLRTRSEAEAFLTGRGEVLTSPTVGEVVLHEDDMEPQIPSLATLVLEVGGASGPLNVLTDDHGLFDDSTLDYVRVSVHAMAQSWMGRSDGADFCRTLVRGDSVEHPSLQLADVVAGAGLAVVRRHLADPSPIGEDLYTSVIPLITKGSILACDDPSDLAAVIPRN